MSNGERGVRARVSHLCSGSTRPSRPSRALNSDSLVRAARWAASEEGKAIAASALEPPEAGELEGKGARPASGVKSSESKKASEAKKPSESKKATAPSDDGLLAGTRYRLLRTIGRGAMGVVYEAEHVDLLRRVALKVISPENAALPEFAPRSAARRKRLRAPPIPTW